jgi:hypothetical protein
MRRAIITFWSFPAVLMGPATTYQGKLPMVASPLPCAAALILKEGTTPMTFPTPILASAFVLAGAALLALRSAAFATRRSIVKVRSNRRRPAGGRSKTND